MKNIITTILAAAMMIGCITAKPKKLTELEGVKVSEQFELSARLGMRPPLKKLTAQDSLNYNQWLSEHDIKFDTKGWYVLTLNTHKTEMRVMDARVLVHPDIAKKLIDQWYNEETSSYLIPYTIEMKALMLFAAGVGNDKIPTYVLACLEVL